MYSIKKILLNFHCWILSNQKQIIPTFLIYPKKKRNRSQAKIFPIKLNTNSHDSMIWASKNKHSIIKLNPQFSILPKWIKKKKPSIKFSQKSQDKLSTNTHTHKLQTETQPYQIKFPNSQFTHLKKCNFKIRTFLENSRATFSGNKQKFISSKRNQIQTYSFSKKPNTNCHECTPKNKQTKSPNSHFTHKQTNKKKEMPFQAQTFLETWELHSVYKQKEIHSIYLWIQHPDQHYNS